MRVPSGHKYNKDANTERNGKDEREEPKPNEKRLQFARIMKAQVRGNFQ